MGWWGVLLPETLEFFRLRDLKSNRVVHGSSTFARLANGSALMQTIYSMSSNDLCLYDIQTASHNSLNEKIPNESRFLEQKKPRLQSK